MSPRRLPRGLRFVLFLAAAAAALGAGMILCRSPSEAVHFAAVPGFIAYVLTFRRDIPRRVRGGHFVYFALLAAGVAAYLIAFARTAPELAVRWVELPAAVYFLAALHIMVWVIDRVINAICSAAFGLGRDDRRPLALYAPKTFLRVLLVAAVAGPYLIATFLTHWPKFGDGTDPWREFGMSYQSVRFDATDGGRVCGWYIPAAEARSDSAVLLAAGCGLSKGCFLAHARVLRDNGYNVLLLDLRGEGGSDGHTRSFGVYEANDVLGGLRYLKQSHPRGSRHVFALGLGNGAGAVIAAAAADPRIEAVVVDSGFARPAGTLSGLTRTLPRFLGRYLRAATLVFASAELGCNFFQARAEREIVRIGPRPTLIIHGQGDKVSAPEAGERLYAAAKAPKMLWKVPGAGHCQAILHMREDYVAQVLGVFKSVRQDRPVFQ